VKSPGESKEKDDFFKLVATVPASQAFRSIDQSTCKLVKK